VHHNDFDVAYSLRASLVHGGNLLHTLSFQPVAKFGDCDDGRRMLLCDLYRITDVIEVAVGTEHDIHFFNVLLFLRTHGISHDPRIDEDSLAGRGFDQKSSVTQPRKFDSIQIHCRSFWQSALTNWHLAQKTPYAKRQVF